MEHVYQQRYKIFPIQEDEHFVVVCRTVERNVLRAGLVKRAEDWCWGSLWRWLQRAEPDPRLLSKWPLRRLSRWVDRVNESLSEAEWAACRLSPQRGKPLGDASWEESIVRRLNLESTMQPRGCTQVRTPKKPSKKPDPFDCSKKPIKEA